MPGLRGRVQLISAAAVSNSDCQDDQLLIDDLDQDAVVTDAMAPNAFVVRGQTLPRRRGSLNVVISSNNAITRR